MTTESPADVSARSGHGRCLLCGESNPWSLKLAFHVDSRGVKASFHPHRWLQGYEGILHGGVISALLDAAMTHCLFHRGVRALTADLRIRFVEPVPCHAALDLRAWILSATPPLYRLRAELSSEARILAWAEAKFLRRRTP
ncbi:MAG: PaaI family thioesterase [Candidatus Eisenbacteria bacterium]